MENVKQYVPAATGMLACAWVAAYAGFTLGTDYRANAEAAAKGTAPSVAIVERVRVSPHLD